MLDHFIKIPEEPSILMDIAPVDAVEILTTQRMVMVGDGSWVLHKLTSPMQQELGQNSSRVCLWKVSLLRTESLQERKVFGHHHVRMMGNKQAL